jgi:chromosome segregation ATPase
MFMETPDTLLYVAGGAFLLGWLVAKISAALAGRIQARKRDPRDDRIRNLEAELRIAQSDSGKAKEKGEEQEKTIEEEKDRSSRRDIIISDLQEKITKLKSDLKDSVVKTRELRHELSHRAEENVRSEVKLREVETELSVAQASTDLIATGVLDYSVAPDPEDAPEYLDTTPSKVIKAAT